MAKDVVRQQNGVARFWTDAAVLAFRETWSVVLDSKLSATLISVCAVAAKPVISAATVLLAGKPLPPMTELLADVLPGAVVVSAAFAVMWLVKVVQAPAMLHAKQHERIQTLEALPTNAYSLMCDLREELMYLSNEAGGGLGKINPGLHAKMNDYLRRLVDAAEYSLPPHEVVRLQMAINKDRQDYSATPYKNLDGELDRILQTIQPATLPVPPSDPNIEGLLS